VCLEPCRNGKEAVALSKDAVESHLRLIIGFDEASGYFETTSQPEPIVSEAAACVLSGHANCWRDAMETLCRQFLGKGLIDRGRMGELVARILCVMARDDLLCRRKETPRVDRPKYAQPFDVISFLDALLCKANKILDLSAQLPKENKNNRVDRPTLRKVFQGASLNFTHFVATTSALNKDCMKALLHRLLLTQAALQLAPNQRTWDILIPVYLGDLNEPFDEEKGSAILIQVKNCNDPNQLKVEAENYNDILGLHTPLITILLDLGLSDRKKTFTSVDSYHETVFAFRVNGCNKNVYGCLLLEIGFARWEADKVWDKPSDD
jgi:hypothetical protein